MVEKQVFSDYDERNDEPYPSCAPSQSSKHRIRRPTEEEIIELTIFVVEKVKSNYRFRNRKINIDVGAPRGVFVKEKEAQGKPKRMEKKELNRNKQKHTPKEENKESPKHKQKSDETKKKRVKEESKGDPLEQKNITKIEITSFNFTQALSQVKMSIPLLEMMKIKEYKGSAIQLISNQTNRNYKV